MRLFDTHTHLTDDRFDTDREKLLASLKASDVELVLECATSPEDWCAVSDIANHDFVYAAFGVHPHGASEVGAGYLDELSAYLNHPKCVALGEIGLDYHYDFSPRVTQKKVFYDQIELAIAQNKPIVIHDREAHADVVNALRSYRGKIRGTMHCYSGSAELAKEILDMGFYIAFGGALTFSSAKKTRAVAQSIPLDRLLIETDCPYLTPEPFRGKRNDPTFIKFTCEMLANIHGKDTEEMADITFQNGKTCFGL